MYHQSLSAHGGNPQAHPRTAPKVRIHEEQPRMPELGGHPHCQLLPWAEENLLSAACSKVLAHALPTCMLACACPHMVSEDVSEGCTGCASPVGSQDKTAEVAASKSGPSLAASMPACAPSCTRHRLQHSTSDSASMPPGRRGSGSTSTLMSRLLSYPAPQADMLRCLRVT